MSIQKKSADEERERLLKDQRLRQQQRISREIKEKDRLEAEKIINDFKKIKTNYDAAAVQI